MLINAKKKKNTEVYTYFMLVFVFPISLFDPSYPSHLPATEMNLHVQDYIPVQ